MECNAINDIVHNQAMRILKEKDKLIKKRLKELGIYKELNKDKNRRFKKFKVEHNYVSRKESYFYDDGTKKGLHVITFREMEAHCGDIGSFNYRIEYKFNEHE